MALVSCSQIRSEDSQAEAEKHLFSTIEGRIMKTLLIGLVILLSGCVSLEYKDPKSEASFEYSSFLKTATDVQIVYTSPKKTVGVSLGSTANDLEQLGDIIKSYNVVGEDK